MKSKSKPDRHKPAIAYNVKIAGHSVGMTFDLAEASSWVKASRFAGHWLTEIVPVKHDVDADTWNRMHQGS